MGKCKDCGAPAVDGEEYCEACLLLRDLGLTDDSEDSDMNSLLPSDSSESNFEEESLASNLDNDILSLIDTPATEEEVQGISDDDILSLIDTPATEEEVQGISDDDILSLIDTPATEEEVQGISDDDILSLIDTPAMQESDSAMENESDGILSLDNDSIQERPHTQMNRDMGDVLSDALGVLNDPAMDDMEKQLQDLLPEEPDQEEEVKKAKGLFKKLFANVPDPEPDPNAPTAEELEEKRQAEKEEKKQAKAAKKAEQKQAKEAKQKVAKEQKAARLANKKRLKEEAAQNEPVDTGHINKAGASIIFFIAACLAVIILVGTNTFTYSNNVSSAKKYFSKKQYTKAYQQIAGTKIKKKDKNTYEKIATVMYVNKEYDSFNHFYDMEMYPQSLDSLIRGLKRYDKCKEDASELNVTSDLDYVKSNIVHSLKDSFNLKENDVQYLMSMDSQDKYSKEIVKLAKAS